VLKFIDSSHKTNTHATETMLATITVSLRCMWCHVIQNICKK